MVIDLALPVAGIFDDLVARPADALLGIIAAHRADPRPDKIDLGVGVFRDDDGRTPVMHAVKAAERQLVETQATKAYLGAEGDQDYTDALAIVALGHRIAASHRLTGVQTPGGTGALRLGAELIERANRQATVWIGWPTWPNHAPLFRSAGLKVAEHRFYDPTDGSIDMDGLMADLADARPGDVLLLHGCCHNPTGANFTPDQWRAIAQLCQTRGLIPFIDLAYQGLGDGLEADAAATRTLMDSVPNALLAYSCDKNFGLYRDRVGALWLHADTAETAALARSNMLSIARSLWSMPPDWGAAIVRTILASPSLTADWQAELDVMRMRINALRTALANAHPALAPIGQQRGMFALLPIDAQAVRRLREDHGVYMAGNGRISIAGLTMGNIAPFANALKPYLA
ncbi:aromatic amino acid transaminase [Sphingobium sp.]|uniref:amino acid aminotransferase n=1 Tax=Sphingobium sp. TaxID=1912891 RepID=UPI003B3BAE99